MKTNYIITDSVSLENKEKPITRDSFYEDNRGPVRTSDSAGSKKVSNNGNEYYALLSVSDKEINGRTYDKESWKKTVTDGLWLEPYNKPLLRNHDLWYADPNGRITDAYFVDMENKFAVTSSSGTAIDNEVFKHFKDKKAFDEGTGAVIVKFIADEDTASRIEDGLDMTVSQSSSMGKFTCNICNNSYYSYDCTHSSGRFYPKDEDKPEDVTKCVPKAYDFDPIELSIVNRPANDVSTIFVKKPSKTKANGDSDEGVKNIISDSSNNSTDAKDPKFDGEAIIVDNSHVEGQQNTGTEVQDNLFKNIARDHFKSILKSKVVITEDCEKLFDEFFETIANDEQADKFGKLITAIEKTVDSAEGETTTAQPETTTVTEGEVTTNDNKEADKVTDSAKVEEPVKTADEGSKEPVKTEDNANSKAEILETVLDNKKEEIKVKKFEDQIKDKELLALIKNM